MLIDVAISGERNVIKKETDENVKYKDFKIKTQRVWNVKTNVIPRNNRGNWNHLKIILKISEQHTGKVRHQGTTICALRTYFGQH
jgi:hypothetical protein